ncbi:MAG: hydrogenase maturation nickel metallochaperone HypA [Bacillota bacterium]
MHETAIMEGAMEIVLAKAKENNLSKINIITAKVGELSGALPEALVFAFDAISKGTIADGALFKIDTVKATAKCEPCDMIFEVDSFNKLCPRCNTFSRNILTGYELYINTIEGE